MGIEIKNVSDPEFCQYGKILKGYDVRALTEAMKEKAVPEDVIYAATDQDLESLEFYQYMKTSVYGNMPVQIGYCSGHNHTLNALEYHRSSEINIAVTDMILLLGKQQDMKEDFSYRTELTEAFLIPKGTVVELFATTLHYAPCGVNGEGFQCVVVLPKGTNEPLEDTPRFTEEDTLLYAQNKWLTAHREAGIENAFVGLIGENITI